MGEIKVMCARSMHLAVGALTEDFTRRTGHGVELVFGTVGGLQERMDRGETADVLILSDTMIDRLVQQGTVRQQTRLPVARTYIAVCIAENSTPPAIATPTEFEQTLRDADLVAVSDPAVGGSAGLYLEKMFQEMGLADLMAQKGRPQKTGAEVAKRVAEGSATLGLTLSGEIAGVPGVVIAGPLPPPLGSETSYWGAVASGSVDPETAVAFLAALTAADAQPVWTKAGFDTAA